MLLLYFIVAAIRLKFSIFCSKHWRICIKAKFQIAVIGCGSIGRSVHLPLLKNHKKGEVVAVVDPSPENLAATEKLLPKANRYSNSSQLYDNHHLDAIIIATPPNTHVELAMAAIKRGIAIYMEKPLALNAKEGKELLKVTQAQNITNMIGFNFRFNPVFKEMKKALSQNAIGEIRLVRTIFSITKEHAAFSGWRGQLHYGGVSELGSHHFDLLGFLFDQPITSISSHVPAASSEFSATLNLLINDKIPVHSHFSFEGSLEQRIEVFGSEGSLIADRFRCLQLRKHEANRNIFDYINDSNSIVRILGNLPAFLERCLSPWGETSYGLALDAFINAVAKGELQKPDFSDGLAALMLVKAAEEAIQNKTTISVNGSSTRN